MKKLAVFTVFAFAAALCFSCNGKEKSGCTKRCKSCAHAQTSSEVFNNIG